MLYSLTFVNAFQSPECDPLAGVYISLGQHPLCALQLEFAIFQAHFFYPCLSIVFLETYPKFFLDSILVLWCEQLILFAQYLLPLSSGKSTLPAFRTVLSLTLMVFSWAFCPSVMLPQDSSACVQAATDNTPASWTSGQLTFPF